jgi:hypothetical protein
MFQKLIPWLRETLLAENLKTAVILGFSFILLVVLTLFNDHVGNLRAALFREGARKSGARDETEPLKVVPFRQPAKVPRGGPLLLAVTNPITVEGTFTSFYTLCADDSSCVIMFFQRTPTGNVILTEVDECLSEDLDGIVTAMDRRRALSVFGYADLQLFADSKRGSTRPIGRRLRAAGLRLIAVKDPPRKWTYIAQALEDCLSAKASSRINVRPEIASRVQDALDYLGNSEWEVSMPEFRGALRVASALCLAACGRRGEPD